MLGGKFIALVLILEKEKVFKVEPIKVSFTNVTDKGKL